MSIRWIDNYLYGAFLFTEIYERYKSNKINPPKPSTLRSYFLKIKNLDWKLNRDKNTNKNSNNGTTRDRCKYTEINNVILRHHFDHIWKVDNENCQHTPCISTKCLCTKICTSPPPLCHLNSDPKFTSTENPYQVWNKCPERVFTECLDTQSAQLNAALVYVHAEHCDLFAEMCINAPKMDYILLSEVDQHGIVPYFYERKRVLKNCILQLECYKIKTKTNTRAEAATTAKKATETAAETAAETDTKKKLATVRQVCMETKKVIISEEGEKEREKSNQNLISILISQNCDLNIVLDQMWKYYEICWQTKYCIQALASRLDVSFFDKISTTKAKAKAKAKEKANKKCFGRFGRAEKNEKVEGDHENKKENLRKRKEIIYLLQEVVSGYLFCLDSSTHLPLGASEIFLYQFLDGSKND